MCTAESCLLCPDVLPSRIALSTSIPNSVQDSTGVLVNLCNEVMEQKHAVLLFCGSRAQCESCAALVARRLPPAVSCDPEPCSNTIFKVLNGEGFDKYIHIHVGIRGSDEL